MRIDGACHCGRIRYEAEIDPARVELCHCTDCQLLTGTAFRATVSIPERDFSMKGDPKLYVKTTADSGTPRVQAFCGECGSPIYSTSVGEGPRIYNLRLGTARQRAELPPQKQYWWRSALPWVTALADLPRADRE